jgi:hypothetical protein
VKTLLIRIVVLALASNLIAAVAARANTNLMMTIENNTSQTLYWLGDQTSDGNINEFPTSIAPGASGVVQATHNNGKGGGGFGFGNNTTESTSTCGIKIDPYAYSWDSLSGHCDNKIFSPQVTGACYNGLDGAPIWTFTYVSCGGSNHCDCTFDAAVYDASVGFTDKQRDELLLQYLRHTHKERKNKLSGPVTTDP